MFPLIPIVCLVTSLAVELTVAEYINQQQDERIERKIK